MNILQAIEHFEWKFKNTWKPSKKDIEAYNAIIDFKDLQTSKNLSENESLAKLLIHQIMLLNQTKGYDTKESLRVIHEILSKSVYEWCKSLHAQSNLMRFNSVLSDENYHEVLRVGNITKMREIALNNVKNNNNELTEALTMEIKEGDVIKWVENIVTGVIHQYEK